MLSRAKSRGSGSGCFIRFLVLVVVGFMLIGPLLRCAQRLPQMAANTAASAASGAGNAVTSLGRRLLDRLESWWSGQSPAEQFNLVCEHFPVEGVDKVCPYFTSALQGATEAQAAQTACYLTAAGTGTQGQQRLQYIQQSCPQTPGNAAAFQSCVETYVTRNVEPGDWSSCLASSEQQFESEVHTMSEPIACIPGLPKSWCTTQSSSAGTTASATSPPPRTDVNYLNCLGQYYQTPAVRAQYQMSCGSQISSSNAACIRGQLTQFEYPGQIHLGQQYVAACDHAPLPPPQ